MGLFIFCLFGFSLLNKVFTKASEKWLRMGRGTCRTISHALSMVISLFGLFCEVFAMKSCFQRPFSSISCIFNLSKHLPIAKKWQIQWEGVLTNCNQAKSNGKVVSTKAFASSHKKQFIGQFQLILVLVSSLRILTHND